MLKKKAIYALVLSILFFCTNLAGAFDISLTESEEILSQSIPSETHPSFQLPASEGIKQIEPVNLPWIESSTDLLEWWITVEYDGQQFQQKVPVDIADFRNRFLKHPEYGEILQFNVDDDPGNDIEVKVGVYWAVILNAQGKEVRSLEQRSQVRLLNEGEYVDDEYAELEVWSDLQLNYGLIKTATPQSFFFSPLFYSIKTLIKEKFDGSFIDTFLDILLDRWIAPSSSPTPDDEDNVQMGAGFRSPDGEKIPLYIEKRFSFARESLFSPSLFQHILSPSSSNEELSLEMLYGLRSYKAEQSSPSYDIGFSIQFDPALHLKSKFIPKQGILYYFFNQQSQRNDPANITFTSSVDKGEGESISLNLLFDSIKDSLAQDGRWMGIDIDILNDNDLLAGSFHYDASHPFDINFTLNSPLFEEKMQLADIPTDIDVSWDLDMDLTLPPQLFASANGFIDISMNDDLGFLRLFYPDTSFFNGDNIFIDLPEGLPRSTRVEADVTVSLDLTDVQDPGNFVSGRLAHECSQNIAVIDAYLPRIDAPIAPFDTPILHITDIPSLAEANGKLYWNSLRGHAQLLRNSTGPPDPVELTLTYGNLSLYNHLEIRDGYIDTRFDLDEDGYFHFDTSRDVMGNTLSVSNSDTGDSLGLSVEELSADDFKANWDLDTTGNTLQIPTLKFNGMLDRLRNLQVSLDYQGKQTDLLLDWTLRQKGNFMIEIDQSGPLSLDFDEFAPSSEDFSIGGGITIDQHIAFDMGWNLQQGEKNGGVNDPGQFIVNEHNDQTNLQHFDFYLIYQDQYGINISLENVKFYLNFEWWKGDRLLPYLWLDYEVSSDEFTIDLLWTNRDGTTQWHQAVEEW